MAKFKLVSEMEKRGMKGQFNGFSPNGNPKYYKFKTTHMHRERHEKQQNRSINLSGFEIGKTCHEDIYKSLQTIHMGYDRFLRGLDEQSCTYGGHNTSS